MREGKKCDKKCENCKCVDSNRKEIRLLMDAIKTDCAQNDVLIGEEFGVYLFDKTYQKVN